MKWVKLYTDILRDPLLSRAAKACYALIKTHCGKEGMSFPSKRLLEEYGAGNEKTVTTSISELFFFGVLTWNSGFRGKANTYFLNDEVAASNILHHKAPQVSFQQAEEANLKAEKEHQKAGSTTPLKLPYPTLLLLRSKKNHRRSITFQDVADKDETAADSLNKSSAQ